MHEVMNSLFFKSHSLYAGVNSLNLQFITYYDEVEVSNPLGKTQIM